MLDNKLRIVRSDKVEQTKSITYVNIEHIRPNPYQPRRQFNKLALEELCESIKQYGVLQPVTVRQIMGNAFELITGERRLRAATLAGLKIIPCIIMDISDSDAAVIALIENLQREDLTYIEEAESYNVLIVEHRFTQEQLATKIGKSQSTVANKIRLLKLSPIVKKILMDNNLTERHARALLKLHDEQLQLKVLKIVQERSLNVKKTEELIERVIDKYAAEENEHRDYRKSTKAIKDIRIFVNTIKQAIDLMKRSGVNAKAAQLDRGKFVEFIVRIPK